MPKRWFTVGSLGIRKTRANLYLSGHVRYVSMSEALSSRPSPRVGRNGSSDGPARGGGAGGAGAGGGQERLERRLVAGGDRGGAGARVALGVEHHVVERARLEDLALLRGRG